MPIPSRATRRKSSQRSEAPASVFLNLPYDGQFENLCLAYIAGVSSLGLIPRATLQIAESRRRLERILDLVSQCPFSVHDLSRVELDLTRPYTPRFNMPFELGLAVACQYFTDSNHAWFVYEARPHRLQKSLSDLNGTDPFIHGGTTSGVFHQLSNSFVRRSRSATVQQMQQVLAGMRSALPEVKRKAGADTVFSARPFEDLCAVASGLADRIVLGVEP